MRACRGKSWEKAWGKVLGGSRHVPGVTDALRSPLTVLGTVRTWTVGLRVRRGLPALPRGLPTSPGYRNATIKFSQVKYPEQALQETGAGACCSEWGSAPQARGGTGWCRVSRFRGSASTCQDLLPAGGFSHYPSSTLLPLFLRFSGSCRKMDLKLGEILRGVILY